MSREVEVMARQNFRLDSFDLQPGRVIGGKYVVDGMLGAGWEGEVYRVVETRTKIHRAAKLFFPRRTCSTRLRAGWKKSIARRNTMATCTPTMYS